MRPKTQTRYKQNIDTKQTQCLIYRFRCITESHTRFSQESQTRVTGTCQHKSHIHDSLGKGEGGEGRGELQTRHQRHSKLAYSLSFYSAQTESITLEVNQSQVSSFSQSDKKGETTHRAAEMQRPLDDLPSAAPRSRHLLLPPP